MNDKAEEICISTRLLSLVSQKRYGQSKQELKNDLIKGEMTYPLTISGVLNFLQCHSLTPNQSNSGNQKQPNIKTAFVIDGDKDESGQTLKPHESESTVCRYWEEGTCKGENKAQLERVSQE